MKRFWPLTLMLCILLGCSATDIPVGTATGKVVSSLGGNAISEFVFDNEGYVWLIPSSGRYLYKTDGAIMIQYANDPADSGSICADKVNGAVLDGSSRLWVATQKGVDRYNSRYGNFEHIPIDDSNVYVTSITRSAQDRICIATRRHILEYSPEKGRFIKAIQTPAITITEPHIFFDKSGFLWTQFDNLLICYDRTYNVHFRKEYNNISGNVVYDGDRFIWIIENGIPRILNTLSHKESPAFEQFPELSGVTTNIIYRISNGAVALQSSSNCYYVDEPASTVIDRKHAVGKIRTLLDCLNDGSTGFCFGPSGNLWASVKGGGYRHYIFDAELVPEDEGYIKDLMGSQIPVSSTNGQYLWTFNGAMLSAYSITDHCFTDKAELSSEAIGRMAYISSSRSGQILLGGSPRSNSPFHLFSTDADGRLHHSSSILPPSGSNGIIAQDGSIYAAAHGTRLFRLQGDGEFTELANIFNDYASYASMFKCLSGGELLICYTDHCPAIFNPNDDSVRILEEEGLNQVYFSSYAEDSKGNLWIGSTDKGLYFYNAESGLFRKVQNYPDSSVNGISIDNDGNVFVMNEFKAVYRYINPGKGSPVWSDHSDYPVQRTLINLPDGTVALLGSQNYEWFNRERLEASPMQDTPVHVFLTSGNKIIASFLTTSFPKHKLKVRLNRRTDGLNMYLSLMDRRNQYTSYSYYCSINRHRTSALESIDNPLFSLYGVSRPWNTIKFWVSDNTQVSQTEPFTIQARMNLLPAEIITPLALIILIIAALWFWLVSKKKNEEAEEERIKREMTEKMNMENIDFFSNISHEFRTPLSLIHGAAESITTADDKTLGIIKRNTDRMLKLVSQILDFNKLDHGMLKLNVKMESVSEIISTVKSNFEVGAKMKSISLNLKAGNRSIMGWVDRDKLEKILYNLCSNAIKYTPPGGEIDIEFSENDGHILEVSVADSGIGIPEDALEAVFERFYQTASAKKTGGTGIGLYYTRALVNLHHGSISASTRKDGDKVLGAVFTFSIPIGESAYSQQEKELSTDDMVSVDASSKLSEYIVEEGSSSGQEGTEKRPSVMLIDDDYEIVYYLKNLLSDQYSVHFKFDATSGYKMIEEVHPDIIISDMMMMDVDGIQLCRMVKENISMSHIPFIMLTAKSTVKDQIESLGAGADAYVVKPFNSDYLLALVKSMLDNRNRMRNMLQSSIDVPKESKDELNTHDRQFVEKMYEIMKRCLQNGEMDIESVAGELGVSRSKFYYKVKALTGQTPNEFFTTYKLNYSAELLKEGKLKIAAIADMLGFSSASHYASLFKKQFGVSPSQYTNQ